LSKHAGSFGFAVVGGWVETSIGVPVGTAVALGDACGLGSTLASTLAGGFVVGGVGRFVRVGLDVESGEGMDGGCAVGVGASVPTWLTGVIETHADATSATSAATATSRVRASWRLWMVIYGAQLSERATISALGNPQNKPQSIDR